jgi:subtilisin family serine protease
VGEDVLSTVPGGGWEQMSGTSMATPRVAGAAALMFAANPNLTAAQARDLLVKTVEKDADLNGKVSTGGKLDLNAAVAAARALANTQGPAVSAR